MTMDSYSYFCTTVMFLGFSCAFSFCAFPQEDVTAHRLAMGLQRNNCHMGGFLAPRGTS